MKTGIEIIAEERERQINEEGYSLERDDRYTEGELSLVGAYYAMSEEQRMDELSKPLDGLAAPTGFPWDIKWWKPTPEDRVRELQKAGALIAAEIDRLNRLH